MMMAIVYEVRRRVAFSVRGLRKDQTGAQTIEWIALGILIMAMMAGAAAIVKENNTLGETIVRMIERILNQMGAGEE